MGVSNITDTSATITVDEEDSRTFNIYDNNGAKILDRSTLPTDLTNLTPETTYTGYTISAVEGDLESLKVTIPEFTTTPSEAL